MDPMTCPYLVRKSIIKFLDDRAKKSSRLVSWQWMETFNQEGRLSIIVKADEEGNEEFISNTVSNCFSIRILRISPKMETMEDQLGGGSELIKLQFTCSTSIDFLKKQLTQRFFLRELILQGEFFWKSDFCKDAVKVNDTQVYNGDRYSLPNLKVLRIYAEELPARRPDEWNIEYNAWGVGFRTKARNNMFYILQLVSTPALEILVCKDISCFIDQYGKNIKTLVEFLDSCSRTLKQLHMSNQPTCVTRNYDSESLKFPQFEELTLYFYDVDIATLINVFDTEGYWGRLLLAQTKLQKLHWEYLTYVPKQIFVSVITANQHTLTELNFACSEYNTRTIIINEENVVELNLELFSGCKNIKKLSLRCDWELVGIDRLPIKIEHLVLEGCLITTENILKLNLPAVKSIAITRNLFSTGYERDFEINEDVIRMLIHIRSLEELKVEKLKNTTITGYDPLERFFENFAAIKIDTLPEHNHPDHFVFMQL